MADNNVLELEKTLQVDGQTYNINAVKADKVANKLVVNTATFGGSISSTPLVEYDGNTPKAFEIIPVTGGKFQGPIRVPDADVENINGISNTKANSDFMDDAVLNYKDIKKNVLSQLINTSVLYSWTGTVLNPTIDKAIAGISLITGKEEHIDKFASYSGVKPTAYLYICSDTANVYFGIQGETPKQIATSVIKSFFNVDLGSSISASFTGHEKSTEANPIKIGVSGTLSIEKGGTGAIKASDACTNIISGQNIEPNRIDVGSDDSEAGRWYHNDEYGLNLNNSDIIGLNGLFFTDLANLTGEGLNFPHTNDADNSTYDRIYASDGKIYFMPNCPLGEHDNTTRQTVYHSGMVIPVSSGGTGQTNLDNVTVGQSKKIKVSYKRDTTTAAVDVYSNITIAPSASYPNGPTGGANGDIMILF